MKRALRLLAALLLAPGQAVPAAADEDAAYRFFADEATVVTASRRAQSASQAPAAVDVITAEDIRASGAVNLWDLLRFRAGLDVVDGRQTSDGNRALVSVRGLAREYVSELQVLVDGRSVYDALASGVTWHRLPVQLQDIERIEIVRGPNAVLYGANAALGVVNIITRKPVEKASLALRQTFGNLGTRLTEASVEDARERFGWRLSHAARANDGYPKPPASDSNDFLSLNTSNLRAWWLPSAGAELELFTGGSWDTAGVLSTRNAQTRSLGHFEMLRWTQTLDGGSSLELTGSRSESFSEIAPTFSGATRQRYYQEEGELAHRVPWNDERLWTVWGGGYRRSVDYSDQLFAGRPRQEQRLARAFAHQTAEVAEKLVLSGGLSYEDYADEPEYQAAALFAPSEDHAVRLSYAAADTVPGLYAASANHQVAKTIRTEGNPGQRPARTTSSEAGYTGRFGDRRLTLQTRLFYLEIRDQPNSRIATFFPVMTATYDNGNRVTARGAELELKYAWKAGASFYANYTHETLGDGRGAAEYKDTTPRHKANLGGAVPLGRGVSLSANAGYKDGYAAQSTVGSARRDIPAYWRLDARLAFEPRPGLELFVAGQNLLRPRHREFSDGLEVPRTYQGGVAVRFP